MKPPGWAAVAMEKNGPDELVLSLTVTQPGEHRLRIRLPQGHLAGAALCLHSPGADDVRAAAGRDVLTTLPVPPTQTGRPTTHPAVKRAGPKLDMAVVFKSYTKAAMLKHKPRALPAPDDFYPRKPTPHLVNEAASEAARLPKDLPGHEDGAPDHPTHQHSRLPGHGDLTQPPPLPFPAAVKAPAHVYRPPNMRRQAEGAEEAVQLEESLSRLEAQRKAGAPPPPLGRSVDEGTGKKREEEKKKHALWADLRGSADSCAPPLGGLGRGRSITNAPR